MTSSANSKHPRLSRTSALFLWWVTYFDDAYSLATIAALLNKQLRKDQPAEFSPLGKNKLSALVTINIALILLLVVTLPNANWQLTLDISVCDVQVRCDLYPMLQNETLKPIKYWFCFLKNAKRKHCTTQEECLEIVCAALLLRPYFESR